MTARRPSRIRRAAKWAGLAACVVITAAWTANYWWSFIARGFTHGGGRWHAACGYGRLVFFTEPGPRLQHSIWSWSYAPNEQGTMRWGLDWNATSGSTGVWLPLWMLFVLVSSPTAWLWSRDHRSVRPGHCLCGYDLAGLAPGAACPECGRKAVA